MEPLSTRIEHTGFTLTQVRRDGNFAVYAQSRGGRVTSYEVIEVQRRKAETIAGRAYPEREAYPGNELWGRAAWTVMDRHEALERLANLVANQPP